MRSPFIIIRPFNSEADILVVQCASIRFNPNLTQSAIDAAIADDPEAARAEWEAEFRTDLAAFLDEATIEAAVDHGRPLELPPMEAVRQYSAFVDPSGGRHDAFAICIGHTLAGTSNMFVADVVRAVRPPFDPQVVVADYAALLKEYRITSVTGDNFSAEWVVAAFREHGIRYELAAKAKSILYLEALPLFMRGSISIPDFPPLTRELRLLERQTHRGGRDTVDHPKRGTDDMANVLAGCAVNSAKPAYPSYRWAFPEDEDTRDDAAEFRRARLIKLNDKNRETPRSDVTAEDAVSQAYADFCHQQPIDGGSRDELLQRPRTCARQAFSAQRRRRAAGQARTQLSPRRSRTAASGSTGA